MSDMYIAEVPAPYYIIDYDLVTIIRTVLVLC